MDILVNFDFHFRWAIQNRIGIILFKVHIQITFYHSVIQLTFFISLSTEKLFKFLMRRNYVARVFTVRTEHLTHFPVKFLSLSDFKHSLAIRRIAYRYCIHRSVFWNISLFYSYAWFNTRFSRVVNRKSYRFFINIKSVYELIRILRQASS